jgi:translation initiation factor IF-3
MQEGKARVNEKIRIPQIRLIDQNGGQVGVVSTDEARRMAREAELDLVEVAPMAKPPVCRIMDYGKFVFEQQKKDRIARKKQAVVSIKEVRLRPGTDSGDINIKAKQAREFLIDGDKVSIQLQFKGREQAHPELGVEMIKRFVALLADVSTVEQDPKKEGRRMTALLIPKKSSGGGHHAPEATAPAAAEPAKA